ncbi:MAG TPA: hypothetical protein VLA62_06075, partial [Solirubrobacterales bacterium]|nr:hypothetical protein [Solirubrobacterales bacterium]
MENLMLFETLLYFTGATIILFFVLSFVRHRDPFHPLIYVAPILFFLYTFLPLYLTTTQGDELRSYFSEKSLAHVQFINWLGVVSICLGALVGSRGVGRWDRV